MNKVLLASLVLTALPLQMSIAQPKEKVGGNRVYSIGVFEMSDNDRIEFKNKIDELALQQQDSRGVFMQALLSENRSAIASKITITTEGLLDVTLSRLNNDLKRRRTKWETEVMKECSFSQSLGMIQEIKDFYSDVSTKSALDVSSMIFDGFSCSQNIVISHDTIIDGRPGRMTDTVNVFYVSCRLDKSKMDRIISHSKFDVYVDSVWFNPYNCDIPNDSLQDLSQRIAFDFKNRSDLKLKIHADIKSSWMNEGTQIFNDQKLGEFDIDVIIDPDIVLNNPQKIYTYKKGKNVQQDKDITVSGESFIVPRSYSGSTSDNQPIWGTGQYKINMIVSESCHINKSYYTEINEKTDGKSEEHDEKRNINKVKWNNNWKKEWKLICKRPKTKTIWNEYGTVISSNWKNGEWLTEITSPTTSYLIKQGEIYLNGGVAVTQSSTYNNAKTVTSGNAGNNEIGHQDSAGNNGQSQMKDGAGWSGTKM